MKTPIKTLLKPLSLALFVAATPPMQNACNQTSPSSNPLTQNAHTQTSPPSNTLPATSPSPSFCKAIGGPGSEWGYSLIQTSDGGYAIAGFTYSFGAGKTDVYVVKLDAKGNLQWTKTIGGPKSESGLSLIQTSDGGYAIAGHTESFGAGKWDVYVVKLDKNGNACCAVSQTSRVGSGGRLGSPTPSIGSGGTLTAPTSSTSSGGTLTNQCP
jgi:hypothetical protein